MIFKTKKHDQSLYNTLLYLSRNIFFYKKIGLPDTFETRVYLMFLHFSIILIVFKMKNKKFNQKTYDLFFHNIEYNLRELGFGDVSVNKKMKEINKILYDILLKLNISKKDEKSFQINHKLVSKYFDNLIDQNSNNYSNFEKYLINFFNYCFALSPNNVLKEINKFTYKNGCT